MEAPLAGAPPLGYCGAPAPCKPWRSPFSPAELKRIATARARLALRGVTLHQLEADDGGPLLVATLGELTRQFSGLSAVAEAERFCDLVAGIAG